MDITKKHLHPIFTTLVILSFFVPLIVVPQSFIFPFIVPKIVVFRSIVIAMLAVYALLVAVNSERYRIRSHALHIGVGLFFLSLIISTFAGVDWYRSFWDTHERMLGLFTLAHFILFYFLLASVIQNEEEWRWLLRVFLLAGGIVMIFGMLQRGNPELLYNRGSARVSATLGNAIYYSGYGLFLLFLGIITAIQEKKSSFWQWYAFAVGLLGLIGIFLGGTRGTVLGLLAGMGMGIVCSTFLMKDHPKIRRGLFVLITAGVLFFAGLVMFRETSFVRSIPTLGSLLNTDISSGTANRRLMAWGIAIDAWQERPVFGWGPNNFYYAFNKYYRPEFLRGGMAETWFDSAHNALLNTLTVQGFFGFVSYLGLFLIPIVLLWRAVMRKKCSVSVGILSISFIAAHFTHNFFVFENPTSYLYFFFFLGFVHHLTLEPVKETSANHTKAISEKSGRQAVASPFLVVAAVAVSGFLIYVTNVNPARANMRTYDTFGILQTDTFKGFEAHVVALNTPTPHRDDVRADFARATMSLFSDALQKGYGDRVRPLFDKVIADLQKNLGLHPLDVRGAMLLAQELQLGFQMYKDPALLQTAESALDQALSHSPKRQQIQYMLSPVKLQLGKKDAAISLLKQSIENDPSITEGWWRLAITYSESGDKRRALETLKEAKEKGIQFDEAGKQAIAKFIPEAGTE